ncbi:MAG: hypothetical protein QM608_02260, partial [Caulobacter sp.]
ITLNSLSADRRVIVFYGEDLNTHDESWRPIWPFMPAGEQRSAGVRLECFDPFWQDDLGAAGADAGGDDEARTGDFWTYWAPYHVQNLRDWKAEGLGSFFVTQAQMQPRPGPAWTSAVANNGRNIDLFAGWMRDGVPGDPTLRPNILTLDYVAYGRSDGSNLADVIVDYFKAISPADLAATYRWSWFGLMSVRAATWHIGLAPMTLGANALPLAPASGGPPLSVVDPSALVTGAEPGWVAGDVLFRAHLRAMPGTVPVYLETPRDRPGERFQYSTRSAAEDETSGWVQLGVAFHAYDAPTSGSAPVYVYSPAGRPHARYRYSTATSLQGWDRMGVAFHAFRAKDGPVPVYAYESADHPGYYSLTTKLLGKSSGWLLRANEFRAHRKPTPGLTAIYENVDERKSHRRLYTPHTAADPGWDRGDVIFYASATAASGLIAIHREAPEWNHAERFYYSPRTAGEAKAWDWDQLDTPFYASGRAIG